MYQKPCTAVFGDEDCGVNATASSRSIELDIEVVERSRVFQWQGVDDFEAAWFTRGRLEVLDGNGAGLWGMVKHDRLDGNVRTVELWEPIRAPLETGDTIRMTAGCDKRSETCREKFDNLKNFRGFPDLPEDDWLMAVPKSSGKNNGKSRR